MKNRILSLVFTIVAFTSGADFALAEQIQCWDQQTGKEVLSIADDMGSITTGGVILGKLQFAFDDNQPYSYYYGEYLFAKQESRLGRVEVAVVRKKKSDRLEGKLMFEDLDGKTRLIEIRCKE